MPKTAIQTKFQLKGVLGSFVNLVKPGTGLNGESIYSVDAILSSDHPQFKELKAAIDNIAKQKWGAKGPANIANGKLASPLRDADAEAEMNEDKYYARDPYKGNYWIKFKTKAEYGNPIVVDRNRNDILDEADCYSGCTFNISGLLKPYDGSTGNGVMAILQAAQVVKKGSPLSQKINVESEFEDLGDEPEDDYFE